ncbi:MAG: UDP-N-acetylmuramoyl-tripeptide--D-alanyl-D-alanine ligase [Spirochaetales bacterium]|jgi:UDP-N-acetylmuramoyl-tripeptide--D-alanyl-D-alanine ligase|nr:UDP-N-acetylmuramoyl-tripeptide--D-alanyl-D-alanine ligase [Spirochaetales bacterium]
MAERLYSLDELPSVTSGEVYPVPGFSDGDIFSVVIDSREAVPGCLFVPLKGERTDGHLYIEEAFSRGGRISFVDRAFWVLHREALRSCAARFRAAFVIVDSSLAALQSMAARFLAGRRAFRIGISGSSGKTTTKEITGCILSQAAPSFMNRGNLNSEIGLPLSVFEMRGEPLYAVFEMGMNHAGEMDVLAALVRPQAALITNIGSAHIGELGSRERIAEEKRKLFLALPAGGFAYAYEGDEYFDFLRRGVKAMVLPFGESSTGDFICREDLGLGGYVLSLGGKSVRFPLPGLYNLRNAMGAVSLARGLGIGEGEIRAGLEAVKPLFGRGQIFRGEVTVLQDCYNANPDSMAGAILFLSSLDWSGRKIAALGSMKELGEASSDAHRDMGALLVRSGFAGVFLFGEEMEEAYLWLTENRFSGSLHWYGDFEELRAALEEFTVPGDIVLVKGSRSMAMERLTGALCGERGAVHA